MSGVAKGAASAFRRQAPRGAKSWGRSLPSISVSWLHQQWDQDSSCDHYLPNHDDPSHDENADRSGLLVEKKTQSTPSTAGTSLTNIESNHHGRSDYQNCQDCLVFAPFTLEWCGGPHCSQFGVRWQRCTKAMFLKAFVCSKGSEGNGFSCLE